MTSMVMSATEAAVSAATGTMSMDHSSHGGMDHGSMGGANSSAASGGDGGYGGHGGMGGCEISVSNFYSLNTMFS